MTTGPEVACVGILVADAITRPVDRLPERGSLGLLYGRVAGWPFERSARFANAVGALATSAVGASEGVHGVAETLAFAGLRQQSWCFVDEVAFIVD